MTAINAFSFAAATNKCMNSGAISASSGALSCFSGTAPISIANGAYSIDGDNYTTAPGTVPVGSSVTVRVPTASTTNTTTTATLTINGKDFPFSATTTTGTCSGPPPFDLVPATAITAATVEESLMVQITNLSPTPSTATITAASGSPGIELSTNGTTWSGTWATSKSVANNNYIKVRLTSGAAGTTRTATVTLNGYTATYIVKVP